jgi:hypothetical protein
MFVLYEVRAQATVLGVIGRFIWWLWPGSLARAGQGPANNISIVLGLRSYVTYEYIPRFVLG